MAGTMVLSQSVKDYTDRNKLHEPIAMLKKVRLADRYANESKKGGRSGTSGSCTIQCIKFLAVFPVLHEQKAVQ